MKVLVLLGSGFHDVFMEFLMGLWMEVSFVGFSKFLDVIFGSSGWMVFPGNSSSRVLLGGDRRFDLDSILISSVFLNFIELYSKPIYPHIGCMLKI